jgi:hypothetical protein
VPAARDIFVAGDAAAADGHGQMVLQSCQHALQLGRYAGENAARDLIGLPTIPYLQPPYITCLDLGRSGAVFTRGWERKVELTGAEAKAVKRRINTGVIYPPHDATREELLALSNLDLALQRWPPAQAGLGTDVTVRSGSMSQSAQRPMATTNRQLPRRSPVARLRRALRDR